MVGMMLKLTEKAKTIDEIFNLQKEIVKQAWLKKDTLAEMNQKLSEKWVRLEDHQQEIDQWKSDFKKLEAMFKCHVDGVNKERGEWKQKLQQLHILWKNRPLRKNYPSPDTYVQAFNGWVREMDKIFVELLE